MNTGAITSLSDLCPLPPIDQPNPVPICEASLARERLRGQSDLAVCRATLAKRSTSHVPIPIPQDTAPAVRHARRDSAPVSEATTLDVERRVGGELSDLCEPGSICEAFIAMERVHGATIINMANRSMAAGTSKGQRATADIVAAAFTSLAELHGLGVAHGDMQPGDPRSDACDMQPGDPRSDACDMQPLRTGHLFSTPAAQSMMIHQ